MAPRPFARAGAIIRSIIEGRGAFGARLRELDGSFTHAAAPAQEDDLAIATETGPSGAEIRRAALLFALTVASTWATGGAAYAGSILTILSCHEAGHYVMCRRYRVPASLPIFIPMPLSPFGTMGAIIRMGGRVSNRRILYDIGIAGPLAGIVPALAAVGWGLAHSSVVSKVETTGPFVTLGDSLIFHAAQLVFFPDLLANEDVLLHPVAFAGWAGLFVTALNLLPIGQLDGGHVLYGLFGARSSRLSLVALVFLAGLAVYYPGWWTLVVLLLIFGVRHPRTLDETSPLGAVRVALGVFALFFFLVSFIPQPFVLP